MLSRRLSPLKIVIYFLVLSFTWIISTDLLLNTLTSDTGIYTTVSIIKGWMFMILTTLFLYWMLVAYSNQRTQSENALRENEERLRALSSSLAEGMVYQIDSGKDGRQRRFSYLSPAVESFHGLTVESVQRDPMLLYKQFLEEDLAMVAEKEAEAFEAKKKLEVDARVRVSSGETRWRRFISSPRLSPEGHWLWDGIELDITERKKSEDEIRESKEQFRTVVEKSPLAMALVDPEGVIEYINLKAIETFGYLPEDIPHMDRWWLQAYPDKAYREEVVAQWTGLVVKALQENREIEQREYRVTCKDGSVKIVTIFGVWAGGKVLAVFDDVTERKNIERELLAYRDHLEELVEERTREIDALNNQLRQSQKLEAVGLLAGGVAHDFSNILTTIKGSIHIIRKRLEKDNPMLKYIEQISSSVDKANNLSQSLLAFSRRQTVILEPLDLNSVIGKSVKLLSRVLGEHVEMDLYLESSGRVIMADRNQMEQILLNLIMNARDAMPGRGKLTIRTGSFVMDEGYINKHGYGVVGEYVLLSVADTGTGMSAELKDKIFEPFFTTKELGKGSGLGLAVVYGIVKQHKGFIVCDSAPGRGTTFSVYLPVVDTEAGRKEDAEILPGAGGTETILLAEDDSDARMTMGEVLRLSGYTVLEAPDGEEAVRIYSEHKERIDLALLDVKMPRMNGREVYESIRRLNPDVEVVFMSGYTDDIINTEGILEQGLNFISKAASPDDILKKIREVLKG